MIDGFSGEYAFMASAFRCDIEFEGIVYPSLEHAFQAAKTDDLAEREIVRMGKSPAGARMAGKKVTLRHGWDYYRVEVMERLIRLKFENPELRAKLLATGDDEIVDANTYHDEYWGKCTCDKHKGYGLNYIGRILMRVRRELREEQTDQCSIRPEVAQPAAMQPVA
jgi:N-glycosidase YbiA